MKNKKTLGFKFGAKRQIEAVGFTLIELLISVSILTILSGAVISIINNSGLQSKARDSQRIADLKKIQVALELYFADYRRYPAFASRKVITGTDLDLSKVLKDGSYLSQVPADPLTTNTSALPCVNGAGYVYVSTGAVYVLTASMEIATSDDSSKCTSLSNWPSLGCGGTGSVNCYGLQNP